MKALVLNDTKVAVRVFGDVDLVLLLNDMTQIGSSTDDVHYFIGYCNANNATLYEGVEPPQDYTPQKYLFDGSVWTLNPALPAIAQSE